jgi:hypothetical protein
LNLNSNSATCHALNPDSFLVIKNKDVKVDLFYMALLEDFSIDNQAKDYLDKDQAPIKH